MLALQLLMRDRDLFEPLVLFCAAADFVLR